MPFKKEQYPGWWKQFFEHIRFERAGNKCEQCGAENYKTGKKGRDGGCIAHVSECSLEMFDLVGAIDAVAEV